MRKPREIRCVRCNAAYTSILDDPFKDWNIITDKHGRVTVECDYDLWYWIGLCPDCQLPEKKGSNGVIARCVGCGHTSPLKGWKAIFDTKCETGGFWGICRDCYRPEKDTTKEEIVNIQNCLKTQEKKIAANERQIERLWEVIKCLGEKG